MALFNKNPNGEKLLTYLACNGIVAGVHLIISTQRASIVPAPLKANLQTRVCFQVVDSEDSLCVVHEVGAENLEKGEFLYISPQTPIITKQKMEISYVE